MNGQSTPKLTSGSLRAWETEWIWLQKSRWSLQDLSTTTSQSMAGIIKFHTPWLYVSSPPLPTCLTCILFSCLFGCICIPFVLNAFWILWNISDISYLCLISKVLSCSLLTFKSWINCWKAQLRHISNASIVNPGLWLNETNRKHENKADNFIISVCSNCRININPI